jgi:hypothetical protein
MPRCETTVAFVEARLATSFARCPFLVLLVALQRRVFATHVLSTVLGWVAAVFLDPVSNIPLWYGRNQSWCATPQGRTIPDVVIVITEKGAMDALCQTHGPRPVFKETLKTSILATPVV